MKQINISFFKTTTAFNRDFIIKLLSQHYRVNVTDNYDYLFFDDTFYYSHENVESMLKLKRDAIRIFLAYEAFFPDMNLFDYAICFNNQMICEDRILKLPYIEFLRVAENKVLLANPKKDAEKILWEKEKFCNFIYGNPQGHMMRECIFYAIEQYARVDALGSFLNNTSINNTRLDPDWLSISIELKKPYKFSIAAENATFPGYTSEKLLTSMEANTIPIYWGNPYVSYEYNQKSFINVMEYKTVEEAVEYIKDLDQNDSLFIQMMEEPWRTERQQEETRQEILLFYDKIGQILSTFEIKRPEGTFVDIIYPRFFEKSEEHHEHLATHIIKKIRQML